MVFCDITYIFQTFNIESHLWMKVEEEESDFYSLWNNVFGFKKDIYCTVRSDKLSNCGQKVIDCLVNKV